MNENKKFWLKSKIKTATRNVIVKVGAFGMAAVIAASPVSALADTTRITTDNLRIRSQPTTASTQIGLIEKGTEIITKDDVYTTGDLKWCELADGGYICINYTTVVTPPEEKIDTTIIDNYLVCYRDSIEEFSAIRKSVSNKTLKDLCDQATKYATYASESIIKCNSTRGRETHDDNLDVLYSTVYNFSNQKLSKKTKNATYKLLNTLYDLPKLILVEKEIKESFKGTINMWRQGDPHWADIAPGMDIGPSGCAEHAICVQLALAGLVEVDNNAYEYDVANRTAFNPASFAKAWNKAGGLSKDMSVSWKSISNLIPEFQLTVDETYHYAPGVYSYFDATSKAAIISAFDYWVNECSYYPVIETSGSKGRTSCHYVAVVEVTSDDVRVMDSASGKVISLFSRWSLADLDYHGNYSGFGSCILYDDISD